MSSSGKGLAGRYAGALYELSVEAKATDTVLADLTTLKTYLTSAGFTTEDPTALAIALG